MSLFVSFFCDPAYTLGCRLIFFLVSAVHTVSALAKQRRRSLRCYCCSRGEQTITYLSAHVHITASLWSLHTAVMPRSNSVTLTVYLLPSSSRPFIYFAPPLIRRAGQFDSVCDSALINYFRPAGTPSPDIDFWWKSDHSCGCTSCLEVQMYHFKGAMCVHFEKIRSI